MEKIIPTRTQFYFFLRLKLFILYIYNIVTNGERNSSKTCLYAVNNWVYLRPEMGFWRKHLELNP